ncbi:hypothetical protein K402DRAFT_464030 [Aulographum hederae CBS 113979]|uniref:Uncharacterized protein n=1 Tax=Aulographum hederae CBS 113979 TaxID=1176131 RepID=A0A6G1GZ95_9PEZI|nr:hypothetical protein K402DRAFT_464030 [Aulographum hederae CBS 113979]
MDESHPLRDLYDEDPRPTFVVDLGGKRGARGCLRISHRNSALTRNPELLDLILECSSEESVKFCSWWSGSGPNEHPQETYLFGGLSWLQFVVKEKWRVVSCTTPSHRVSNRPMAWRETDPNIPESIETVFNTTRGLSPELSAHVEYIRNLDWAATSLGPIESWSRDLHRMVTLMMQETHPRALFLGPEYHIIYNHAYAIVGGKKHPAMLGRSIQEAWPEIAPQLDIVIARTEETGQVDQPEEIFEFHIDRLGFLEEGHFRWSLAPLIGPQEGMYSIVAEVTKDILAERRTSILVDVSEKTGTARTMDAFWTSILEAIRPYDRDFPVAALYSLNSEDGESVSSSGQSNPRRNATLEGALGFSEQDKEHLRKFDMRKDSNQVISRFFREASRQGNPVYLPTEDSGLPSSLFVNSRGWNDRVTALIICPIRPTDVETVTGFLLAGLNTRRPYDSECEGWMKILTKMLGSMAASVLLFEEEARNRDRLNEQARINRLEASTSIHRLRSFHHTAAMVDVGFFEIHPSGKILFGNDAWFNLSGHSKDPDANAEMSFMDRILPEDQAFILDKWTRLVEGEPLTFEMRWKRDVLPGSEEDPFTWVLAACIPMFDEDGTIATVSGCTTDIRAQKNSEKTALQRAQALEKARASEQRFIRFMESAPIGIWIVGPDGKINFANDRWFELTGVPKGPFDQVDWSSCTMEEDAHIVMEAWKGLTEENRPANFQCRVKSTWRGADGEESPTWVLVNGYNELAPDGSVNAILGTLVDISPLKWSERVHKRRIEEALESKRQQENFIDMTSHEMRNPLSAMVQSADSIALSLHDLTSITKIPNLLDTPHERHARKLAELIETSSDAVQTILSCAMHQKRIVDDVLTLSKLDSKLLLITPIKVRPETIMHDTAKMFEAEAAKSGVQLQVRVEQSVHDLNAEWVLLDPSRVLQVLINLITNAIKFTQSKSDRRVLVRMKGSRIIPSSDGDGTIEYIPRKLDTRESFLCEDFSDAGPIQPDDRTIIYLAFSVEDTGVGLSKEEKDKLFLRFSQASPRTHVQYGGSGLGLFISRQLTEMQGGQIGVASEAGAGSTFAFYVKSKITRPPVSTRNTPTQLMGLPIPSATPPLPSSTTQTISTEAVHTPAPPPKFDFGKLSILIVEDNLVNQRVLANQLKRLGCTVHVAGHGVEALELICKTQFWNSQASSNLATTPSLSPSPTSSPASSTPLHLHLVLMDIEMPIMDGLTCTKRIRALEADGSIRGHIPIIAVSANARREQVQESLEAGVDESISKPFRIPELVRKVEGMLGGGVV